MRCHLFRTAPHPRGDHGRGPGPGVRQQPGLPVRSERGFQRQTTSIAFESEWHSGGAVLGRCLLEGQGYFQCLHDQQSIAVRHGGRQ